MSGWLPETMDVIRLQMWVGEIFWGNGNILILNCGKKLHHAINLPQTHSIHLHM